nr:T9SS type A sorting domain-containing protein [Bacteroidota bacterium]
MKKNLLAAIFLCVFFGRILSQQIPGYYWGINHWMPGKYLYYPNIPNGSLDRPAMQQLIKNDGSLMYRIGGDGYDTYGMAIGVDSSSNDYIRAMMIIRAQNPNSKFLIQVPYKAGTFTPDSAFKLVNNIKNFFNPEHFYFAIGNECDRYRHPPNKKYFNTEFASIIKSFAIEMKFADPAIKIVAPALSYFSAADSLGNSIMDSLLIGPYKITGVIMNSPHLSQNGTTYYIDCVDFHSYGGLYGDLSTVTNYTAYNTAKSGLINYAGVNGSGFSNELNSLISLINTANSSRTSPSSPLTFAITEMNVCYKNQPPPVSGNKYTNTTEGLSARSYFAGQHFADIMSTLLSKGTSTNSATPKCDFIMPWAIHESNGDGTFFDLSMTKGQYISSTQTPTPVSSYYHYQLLSQHFFGRYYDGTNNKQPLVKTFSSVEDSAVIYVMILNRDTVGSKYNIKFRTNAPPPAPLQLTYNIPATILPLDSADTYPSALNPTMDSIGPNTTYLLMFNCHGRFIWKKSYSLLDAQADGSPHFRQIGNTDVDPQANCGNSGIGGQVNAKTTYSNTTVYVTSDLLITGNNTLTFDNATVIFSPGVKIKANPNAGVEIKNGTIMFGCNGSQWGGIIMNGNHQLTDHLIIDNSILVNAPTVVNADKIGTISIKGSVFANGTTAINLNRSKAFTISGNLIAGYKTAIQTTNTNPNFVSTISENKILSVDKGMDFNGDLHNLLTIACNYIGYNTTGIFSRNTTLASQGSATMSAGNTFVRTAPGVPTDYIDHLGNSTSYFYGPMQAGAFLFPNVMNIPKIQSVADRFCQQQAGFPCKMPKSIGIKENTQENSSFIVFPNPSNGAFTIKYTDLPKGNWMLNVHDVLGRLITSKKIDSNSDNTTLQINAKGLYFVSLQSGSNRLTQKVI